MANRVMYEMECLNRDVVVMAGSFAPNGSSAVSAASNKGFGWSVARDDVGKFTITLQDRYSALLSAQIKLQQATAGDQLVYVGEVDLSAKTIKIYVVDISDNGFVDIAANANNRINFELYLSNTSQTPV